MCKFAVNDIVFINSYKTAEKCKVLEVITEQDSPSVYKLKLSDNFGELLMLEENIFLTKDLALQNKNETSSLAVKEYKKQIKTLGDLLRFPLDHCLFGEHIDIEAKIAYEERTEELTEIFLTTSSYERNLLLL